MEFFKCSIAGVKYGRGVTEIERTMAARAGQVLVEEPHSEDAVRELGFNFDDPCAPCAFGSPSPWAPCTWTAWGRDEGQRKVAKPSNPKTAARQRRSSQRGLHGAGG